MFDMSSWYNTIVGQTQVKNKHRHKQPWKYTRIATRARALPRCRTLSLQPSLPYSAPAQALPPHASSHPHEVQSHVAPSPCLLYTSDAADEEDSVDLGGRRIIKKKKEKKKEIN
eukprot:TRINITY_DN36287_c0_g1_i4.p1 TRINITY_DN36287_c0_g1~~TRINITY_DN36287_c0_g1_i4.p1  ORF type:complete len:114 (-),score=15.12 TRINITY_DN36287_c0_g1_i4:108-449(-)